MDEMKWLERLMNTRLLPIIVLCIIVILVVINLIIMRGKSLDEIFSERYEYFEGRGNEKTANPNRTRIK